MDGSGIITFRGRRGVDELALRQVNPPACCCMGMLHHGPCTKLAGHAPTACASTSSNMQSMLRHAGMWSSMPAFYVLQSWTKGCVPAYACVHEAGVRLHSNIGNTATRWALCALFNAAHISTSGRSCLTAQPPLKPALRMVTVRFGRRCTPWVTNSTCFWCK
jgi:hypothetical protein